MLLMRGVLKAKRTLRGPLPLDTGRWLGIVGRSLLVRLCHGSTPIVEGTCCVRTFMDGGAIIWLKNVVHETVKTIHVLNSTSIMAATYKLTLTKSLHNLNHALGLTLNCFYSSNVAARSQVTKSAKVPTQVRQSQSY